MNGLYTVAATVCATSVIIALISHFVTDGGTKRLLGMVMGAFMVCSMLVPVKNAVQGMTAVAREATEQTPSAATADEVYQRRVLAQTRNNLELALTDILRQNGITVNRAEVVLSLTGENRIIISQIRVYIGSDALAQRDNIVRVTEENFSVRPNFITE